VGKQAVMLSDATHQSSLEQRLQLILSKGVDPQATLAAACGSLESWVLELGEHRLLLHPVQKVWLVYDRLHDSWQPTGIVPGEGMFIAQGKRLGLRRSEAGAPVAAPSARTRLVNPTRCPDCGTPVPPGQPFCANCGKLLQEEAPHG
jgi:hypothetical protein